MQSLTKRLLAPFACLLAASVLLLAVGVWRCNLPPFDLAKLEDLRVGMTADQVRGVLGSPSSTQAGRWAYSGWLSWPIVYIEFDEVGRLASHRYDH